MSWAYSLLYFALVGDGSSLHPGERIYGSNTSNVQRTEGFICSSILCYENISKRYYIAFQTEDEELSLDPGFS